MRRSFTGSPKQPLSVVLAPRQDQASRWRCLTLAWDVRHTCAHFTRRIQYCWIMLFKFACRLIRLLHGSGLDTGYSVGFLCVLSQCLATDVVTDMT